MDKKKIDEFNKRYTEVENNHFLKTLDLLDKAVDEIDLAKDKNKPYLRSEIVNFEVQLIELRTKIWKFNELIDELKG